MGKLRGDDSGHETIQLEAGGTINLHTTENWADSGSTEVRIVIILLQYSVNTIYAKLILTLTLLLIFSILKD